MDSDGEKTMRGLRVMLVLMAAVLAAGCIDVDTLVRVSADGSGSVRERVLVSRTLTAPLRALEEGLGQLQGEGRPGAGFSILDRERLRERAGRMGPGVALVSAEPLSEEDAEGYVARYRFDDVRTLRINQNPGDRAPVGSGSSPLPAKGEYLTFEFTPGAVPELRVRMPRAPGAGEPPDGADPEPPKGPAGEATLAKARELFRGLRVAIAVEVEGTVLESNASHREGSRVVLMEVDFSELLEDPERWRELSRRRPRSLEEAKELLRDLPGVKVETEEEVRIRFRGNRWTVTGGQGPVAG